MARTPTVINTDRKIHHPNPEYVDVVIAGKQSKNKQGRSPMAQFKIFDYLQEGIAVLDEKFRIRYWNEALVELVAIPNFAEFGQDLFAVLPPAFENFLLPALKEARTQDEPQSNICTLGTSFTDRRAFRYRIIPQKCGKKSKLLLLTLTEITQSYRLNREKDQREYLENWGILSVGVTQELTRPLDDIFHLSLELQRQKRVRERHKLRRQLKQIEKKIYQISYLVHNLVGLSHNTMPHFSRVIMHILIDELRQAWFAGDEGCRHFVFEETKGLPAVLGNRVLLSSVLHNLMRIVVDMAGEDGQPQLQCTAFDNRRQVCVALFNHKICLPDDEIGQLLDLFYNRTKISPGTGLALFISKRVIELHGSSLQIYNEAKRGTVFEFHLPQY